MSPAHGAASSSRPGSVGRREALTWGVSALGAMGVTTVVAHQLGDGGATTSAPMAATSPAAAGAGGVLRVGYGEVDGQHEVVTELVDALEWTVTSRSSRALQQHALTDLTRYVRVHFAFEQSLMDTYDIANADQHRTAHQKMLTWVSDVAAQFAKGSLTITPSLIGEIRHWLEVHIATHDVPMARELLAKGVRSAM